MILSLNSFGIHSVVTINLMSFIIFSMAVPHQPFVRHYQHLCHSFHSTNRNSKHYSRNLLKMLIFLKRISFVWQLSDNLWHHQSIPETRSQTTIVPIEDQSESHFNNSLTHVWTELNAANRLDGGNRGNGGHMTSAINYLSYGSIINCN